MLELRPTDQKPGNFFMAPYRKPSARCSVEPLVQIGCLLAMVVDGSNETAPAIVAAGA